MMVKNEYHLDTKVRFDTVKIPRWDEILNVVAEGLYMHSIN